MGQPTTIEGFGQVRDLANEALVKGTLYVECPNEKKAINLRHAIYALVRRDRKQSTEVYEPDDPKFGVSPFSKLSLLIRPVENSEKFELVVTTKRLDAQGFKVRDEEGNLIKL